MLLVVDAISAEGLQLSLQNLKAGSASVSCAPTVGMFRAQGRVSKPMQLCSAIQSSLTGGEVPITKTCLISLDVGKTLLFV